jgi:hypothetical protein
MPLIGMVSPRFLVPIASGFGMTLGRAILILVVVATAMYYPQHIRLVDGRTRTGQRYLYKDGVEKYN